MIDPFNMEDITTLFNDTSVEGRNKLQRCGQVHPYTCGNNRTDAAHTAYQKEHPDEDFGQLIAVDNGWLCPVCGYSQPLHPMLMPTA